MHVYNTVCVWIISHGRGKLLFLSCAVYFELIGHFIPFIRELRFVVSD